MRLSSLRSSTLALLLSIGCVSSGCGSSPDKSGVGDDGGGSDGGGGDDGATSTASDATASETGDDATSSVSDASGDGALTDGGGGGDSASGDGAISDGGGADGTSTSGGDGATGETGPLACGADSDGDGISDRIEQSDDMGNFVGATLDTDKDGTPDYLDTDSDNDGIPDKVEWFTPSCNNAPWDELNDADGDGTPNFRDLDSDQNGLLDAQEACPPATMPGFPAGCTLATPADFDGDGVPDWLDFDNDHDSSKADKSVGVADTIELADNTGKYVGLIDTDKDGIPDLWDTDSDGDFIFDLDDGTVDSDGDGIPNFRDTDSDGDSVPDWCEARANPAPSAADMPKPLLDTNGNGIPDYLDHDSDGDLLADGKEDLNDNCIVDTNETNRIKADTDGDGVSDLVEVTLDGVACAKDPTCTPAKNGQFYFVVPYAADGSAAPSPTSSPLALNTDLQQGDVGFVVDTTYSMDGEFNNLKANLPSIITSLKTRIPSLGIGIAGHDDIPTGTISSTTNSYGICNNTPYGLPLPASDSPWYLLTAVTTDATTATTAVNGLREANGGDLPEDQIVAMQYALTGGAFSWGAYNGCPAGSLPASTGTAGSTFGALGFRASALPIVVEISDARFHNGIYVGQTAQHDTYSFGGPNMTTLVSAFKAAGAKFLGVAAASPRLADTDAAIRDPAQTDSAYADMAYLSDATGSNVPPSAFSGGTCKTGLDGGTVAADGPGGSCRLIFSLHHNGTGLGTQIVDGVFAVLNAVRFDVYVQAVPAAGPVDSVNAFMQKLEPTPTGTDPVTGATCADYTAAGASTGLADNWVGPKAVTAGSDGVNDTIKQIAPGPKYCFNVVPKPNSTVPATTDPQLFTATLNVRATNAGKTYTLGSPRQVLFIVPPVLN
jgi:hypothetical protein